MFVYSDVNKGKALSVESKESVMRWPCEVYHSLKLSIAGCHRLWCGFWLMSTSVYENRLHVEANVACWVESQNTEL